MSGGERGEGGGGEAFEGAEGESRQDEDWMLSSWY